jgi:UDP:flavonoid glycosyltransferase YjiC (YdhE family)
MTEPRKKILYAWELGANYGHIATFLPLAMRLRECGHDVVLALKDLSQIQALPGISDFEVIQAPVWLPEIQGLPEPQVCYPDILQRFGYLDFHGLSGMFKAWRALFRLLQPDLLIADHAPTALFASRGMGFPRTLFGSGFYSPPRSTPLPSMRPLLSVSPERLASSERAVLDTMNRVLSANQLPALHNLAELFEVEDDWLITTEEFDHYQGRGPADYCGPLLSLPAGAQPQWPQVPGPKLFAYLKPSYRHFHALMQQLRTSPYCVLVHAPGLGQAQRRALESPNLRISAAPVDMSGACAQAQAIICNAGLGTVMNACLSGLPVLALPMYVEQNLTGRNISRSGVGLLVLSGESAPDFTRLLGELVDDPSCSLKAQAFARKYAGLTQLKILDHLATRCASLLPGN